MKDTFGETSGIQCARNSLFAICWSSIKWVSVWKSWDLDYIEQGDVFFKNINILRPLSFEELPATVRIDDHVIKVEVLANINRLLGASNMFEKHKNVLPGIGNGLIFTTHGYRFSLIWAKQNINLFDPHSRNKDGSFISSGSTTLLAFKSLSNVENYIKTEYVKHIQNFNETQVDLQYVNIVTEPTSISTVLSSVNKARTKGHK